MKNLCSLLLVLSVCSPHATRSSMSAVWMMAIVEGKEDLHKVVPDGILWDESIMSLGLLYDGGEVTTTTEFHEDVKDAGIAVYVSVMIAYNVFMMEVLENVTIGSDDKIRSRLCIGSSNAHFRDDLLAVALGHALKVELLSCKDLVHK